MHCKICGKQDAVIRVSELKTSKITGRAHVDCNGHSHYRSVTKGEIESSITHHVRHETKAITTVSITDEMWEQLNDLYREDLVKALKEKAIKANSDLMPTPTPKPQQMEMFGDMTE
jgi:hypothetical protein